MKSSWKWELQRNISESILHSFEPYSLKEHSSSGKDGLVIDHFLPRKSGVTNLCPAGSNDRMGCCQPTDMRYLHNVAVRKGKFVAFVGEKRILRNIELPPIVSLHMQKKVSFSMSVEENIDKFDPLHHCKTFFNGTLHVIGRTTAHNVYHTG